ncbi:MAG: chromosome segregation protein SMC [Cryobacterium sp.]
MHLKSLTLKGFKSFAQPTTFAFEPGVTCVVGPNGSGKSNVVDALAWVMGEQGAKTLRGGKMDDVIFAGTSTRGPLGRAAVTLTIDNSDGALPIDYAEVSISRTLFRTGASEYAINGRSCRLLDVQELLSDSGLGREMHVIVGQGQLDAVLRATPEERRGFIEEAAGILKHRRRKEKTLRKLDAMQANLTRLNDLAGEIRRQLTPLGRQADIAREAQTIAATVRDARARLLAADVRDLRGVLDEHGRTESERHAERLLLQDRLTGIGQRGQLLEEGLGGDDVDEARRTQYALDSVQERLRGSLVLATQRLTLLGTPADPGERGRSTVTEVSVTDAAAESAVFRAAITSADEAWAAARVASSTVRARLDAADTRIAAQSARVSAHDLEKSALAGTADAAASRRTSAQAELRRQQAGLHEAAERRQTAHDLAAALAAEDMQGADGAECGGSAADSARQAHHRARDAVQHTEAQIELLRATLHEHERERDAQTARGTALTLALEQKNGSSALAAAQLPGIRGLLADHVRVQPGYETAVAAALGSLANGLLADTRDAATQALRRSRDDDLGRVELIVATPAGAAEQTGRHEPSQAAVSRDQLDQTQAIEQAGGVCARAVVTAPPGVLALLAGCVIVADLAAAEALGASLGDGTALTVITRVGEVLTPVALRGGSTATRSTLELRAERDVALERSSALSALIDDAAQRLIARRRTLAEHGAAADTARAALRARDAERRDLTTRLSSAAVAVAAAEADYARLERGRDAASVAAAACDDRAAAAAAALQIAQSTPRPVLDTAPRDALRRDLEQAGAVEVEARLRVDAAHERVATAEARVVALRARLHADREAALAAARREVIRRRDVAATGIVVAAVPLVLASVDSAVSTARLRVAAAETERRAHNEELRVLRTAEGALRARLQANTEAVHTLDLVLHEKRLQLTVLLDRALAELGLTEPALLTEYAPEQTPPVDRAEQQARLALFERKLARLGRVNPLALEEFAALEQRHRFLAEQLTDLSHTRADLLTIIEEIDGKMELIFQAAFEDTRAAFAEVFPILFPGGVGSIWLTEPDALLTTGIEVSVTPAGKKIERLSLLSGGEKSLAAIALLIAIFKARPSPFYIMDEVEAALDDANLGRLLAIFDNLRESSQLIIITHQKRTMEIADALYGVSMRQDGVSAVVGQRVQREPAAS